MVVGHSSLALPVEGLLWTVYPVSVVDARSMWGIPTHLERGIMHSDREFK